MSNLDLLSRVDDSLGGRSLELSVCTVFQQQLGFVRRLLPTAEHAAKLARSKHAALAPCTRLRQQI